MPKSTSALGRPFSFGVALVLAPANTTPAGRGCVVRERADVAESLVITLGMIMLHEFADHPLDRSRLRRARSDRRDGTPR